MKLVAIQYGNLVEFYIGEEVERLFNYIRLKNPRKVNTNYTKIDQVINHAQYFLDIKTEYLDLYNVICVCDWAPNETAAKT